MCINKKLLKTCFFTFIFLFQLISFTSIPCNYNYAHAQTVVNSETDDLDLAQKTYLAAWFSMAAYNDKAAMLISDVLIDNGWQFERFNEEINSSDVKYVFGSKEIDNKLVYILAISGTDSWQDVKTDIAVNRYNFSGKTVEEFSRSMQDTQLEESNPLVHSGFLQYVQDAFFTHENNNLTNLTIGEELLQKLQKNPDNPPQLYIVGHSLGGAIAELLAARLLDMGLSTNQLHTITFGAPAVGNQAFIDKYEEPINLTRITMGGDPVKNLAQIANTRLVQFKTNTRWEMPELEDDKSTHAMLLYFDRAAHNYYQQLQPQIENAIAKNNETVSNPDFYVTFIYDVPPQLQEAMIYTDLALKDKLLHDTSQTYYFASTTIENTGNTASNANISAQAKQKNAKNTLIYAIEASQLQKNISAKRYYINSGKLIYDAQGNLLSGSSASADTNTMTILQAVLYTASKL